ncbi:hypothetical protein E7T06_02755 [Deinococcus sp. Arct2-2]|uniref:zinc ribbon domain-containing protein n=1 Tax=Deinococcus sp. Arct2-2 TaxID=2568653 RepID=UPI0010A42953|nr:zinc ribbon domain-containing protein [Deinococcus sp. Arct2-2]THF71549.1 hypothetical protein E7T06_02755 [Deinococcus sp. Arct2-2]
MSKAKVVKPAKVVRSTPLRVNQAWTADGLPLDRVLVEQRCHWLLDLTAEVGTLTAASWWTPGHFDQLATGESPDGRPLPKCGHAAARRMGWHTVVPDEVYLPDRFKRGVRVRLMALWQARLGDVDLFPVMREEVDLAGEFDAGQVRATSAGQWATNQQLDRLAQSLTRFRKTAEHDPQHLTEVFLPPVIRRPVLPLSCMDDQFVEMTVDEDRLELKLKLPVVARPVRREDWVWHRICLSVPASRRNLGEWSLPDLRRDEEKILFSAVQTSQGAMWKQPTAALGVDWSPSALVVAAVVKTHAGRLLTTGEATGFDEAGRISKLLRLQREEEFTRRKARRIGALLAGQACEVLSDKHQTLSAHQDALSRKRMYLGRDLAWHAANHLVTLAGQCGAGLIAFEDLRDFDPSGRGAFQNNRSSQSVRGQVYAATEQLAARQGIEVVSVPPRGTSAQCAGCDAPLERPEGYHSAHCPACGLSGGRDVMAAVNIAKRAVLGSAEIKRPKGRAKRIRSALHDRVNVLNTKPVTPQLTAPLPPTRSAELPPRTQRIPKGGLSREMRLAWRKVEQERREKKIFPARLSSWGMVERTRLRVVSSHVNPVLPLMVVLPDG